MDKCKSCNGTGKRYVSRESGRQIWMDCFRCNGTGTQINTKE